MKEKINELINKLNCKSNSVLQEVVRELAYSADKDAFKALMDILEHKDKYQPGIMGKIIYNLIAAARHKPLIMDYLHVYVKTNPGSEEGKLCKYIIDEANSLGIFFK